MEESEVDYLAYSSRIYAYGLLAVTTLQIPLPLLYKPKRRVVVLVDPFYGHKRYRTRVRQETL